MREEQCGCGREGQGADAGRSGEECPLCLGKVGKRPGESQAGGEPPERQKQGPEVRQECLDVSNLPRTFLLGLRLR